MSTDRKAINELDKVWGAGYLLHKATLVKGNRIDEREFRTKASTEAQATLLADILGLLQSCPRLTLGGIEVINPIEVEQAIKAYFGEEV